MNDKMIAENVLSLLKGVADLYLHGTVESACPKVHGAFEKTLTETLCMQHEVYNEMSAKGWYPATQVEQQKIDQLKQKYATA